MTLESLARLKSIPTRYRSVLFRSKLEASVARAMDQVGIHWEYEQQGYDLDGVWYLPDFWCAEIRTFVEVKGVMDTASIAKIDLLAKQANGIEGNPIGGYSERLLRNPFVVRGFVDPPCDAPVFDEREGVHVVVLPRSDISTGHYAPSLCGRWGRRYHVKGSPRISGTVISQCSDGNWDGEEENCEDRAVLVRCGDCGAAFWQAHAGWWGCYVCHAGDYPVSWGAGVRSIGASSTWLEHSTRVAGDKVWREYAAAMSRGEP